MNNPDETDYYIRWSDGIHDLNDVVFEAKMGRLWRLIRRTIKRNFYGFVAEQKNSIVAFFQTENDACKAKKNHERAQKMRLGAIKNLLALSRTEKEQ